MALATALPDESLDRSARIHLSNLSTSGRTRAWRTMRRRSAGSPLSSRSMAKISSMRRTASMAIGARMALARLASSKNLAPPWAQHEASVIGAGTRPFT